MALLLRKHRLFSYMAMVLLIPVSLNAQETINRKLRLNDAIEMALKNNPLIRNSEYKLQQTLLHKNEVVDLPLTQIRYYNGNIHSGATDRYFEINQSIGSLPVHVQKHKVVNNEIKVSQSEQQLIIGEIKLKLKQAWFQWVFDYQKYQLSGTEARIIEENLPSLDDTLTIENLNIEKLEMETSYAEIQGRYYKNAEDLKISLNIIKQYLFTSDDIIPYDTILDLYAIETINPGPDKFYPASQLNYYSEYGKLKKAEWQLEKAKLFPEVSVGYFNQKIAKESGFKGIGIGLNVPLWYFPQKNRIKEAAISHQIAVNQHNYQEFALQKTIENLKIKLDQLFVQISYYRENVLHYSDALEYKIIDEKKQGKIAVNDFHRQIKTIYATRLHYLEKMLEYNLIALQLEYYIN